jgi:hypothetical protein
MSGSHGIGSSGEVKSRVAPFFRDLERISIVKNIASTFHIAGKAHAKV